MPPPHVHRGQAVAAAQAGKHLLLEKAIATTLDDDRIWLACPDSTGPYTYAIRDGVASDVAPPGAFDPRSSWGPAVPPSAAIGAVPATDMYGPIRTAREKPICGSSGEPEVTK